MVKKNNCIVKKFFVFHYFLLLSSLVRAGSGASTGPLSPCGVWLDPSRLLVIHQGPVDTGIFKAVSD